MLYGEQSNAFRETFPNSKAKAQTVHEKASKFHSIDKVQARIAELKEQVRLIAEKDFKIDAAWVLKSAKRVFDRCMQDEPVMSQGEPTGEYKFAEAGANKALEIIGKHIDVQAFNENISIKDASQITPWGNITAGVDE